MLPKRVTSHTDVSALLECLCERRLLRQLTGIKKILVIECALRHKLTDAAKTSFQKSDSVDRFLKNITPNFVSSGTKLYYKNPRYRGACLGSKRSWI